MLELFSNPAFLVAGGALISAPIIIHLINRMRFKRIRWAAMEFLLKSQKRNRRRLIIEQLLLLALRCLLVALTSLIVLRFVGLSIDTYSSQAGLHVILLDDTLSMTDRHRRNNADETAFQVAKNEVILSRIYNNLAQSTTNEHLLVIPLSKLAADPDYQPKVYQKLGDEATKKEFQQELEQLKPSKLHLNMLAALKKADKIFADSPEKRHVLHIVGDFRRQDWVGGEAVVLHKALQEMKQRKVEVRGIDTADPPRIAGQGGAQRSHDNVAVIDFRASTRVIGKGMPVSFTVTVANFGVNDRKVNVVIYDDESGQAMEQVDFNPQMPLKVPAGGTATASFEMRFFPNIRDQKQLVTQKLSAHLETEARTPLDDDGLEGDNVRFASVEIRNKVPILVIDGKNADGLNENGDSFFVEKAILAVPGTSYEVVHGHEIAGGNSVKALERTDLAQFPTIFLLNVPALTDKQRDNLENYVKGGGGVAFFLGPRAEQQTVAHYTKELYRGGKGVFPAPLKEVVAVAKDDLKPTGEPQLLIRFDQFEPTEDIPIFGAIFPERDQPFVFTDIPIHKYYAVSRADWIKEPGKMVELATLPNKRAADAFQRDAVALAKALGDLADEPEYADYRFGLQRYLDGIRNAVRPGSEFRAYQLAGVLKRLLTDSGDEKQAERFPNLTKLWTRPDSKIQKLKRDIQSLYETTQYGDPFIIARSYGKGRVLAVMSSAGKDWNHWGGGSFASAIYPLFLWASQNWLSAQTAESNMVVGAPIGIDVDVNRYKKQGVGEVMLVRTVFKPEPGQKLRVARDAPTVAKPDKDGVARFVFEKNYEPGYYQFEVLPQGGEGLPPLEVRNYTLNVDAMTEGKLQRVSESELNEQVASIAGQKGDEWKLRPATEPMPDIINRQSDLSQMPYLFLIFLIVLVAEQALAVHLSFHMRSSEAMLPGQAVVGHGRAG